MERRRCRSVSSPRRSCKSPGGESPVGYRGCRGPGCPVSWSTAMAHCGNTAPSGDTPTGPDTVGTDSVPPVRNSGYFHHPTVNGESVVFVCEDDLWSVPIDGGPSTRL